MSDTPQRAAFTKGPWGLQFGDSRIGIVSERGEEIASVGSAPYYKGYSPTDYANAHLIAAAPDLVEALQECVDAMYSDNPADGWKEILDKARSVLARARGEG